MQDFDTTSTQSLIDRYYEEEKAQREIEQTLAALTMRLDANDLAMLDVIARRFRKTRDEVAQEVLSNALIDLFARLEAGERKLIARDADDAARALADEIAEENGVANVDVKTGVWANHDRQITKLERKKAKMQEQQASEAKKAQARSGATETPAPAAAEASNEDSDAQQNEQSVTSAATEQAEAEGVSAETPAPATDAADDQNEQDEDTKVSMFGG